MNEILSIVLCFVSGVVVTSIIMAIFEMRNEINGLKQQIEIIENTEQSNHRSIGDLYRCDQKICDEFNREFGEVHRKIDTKANEIFQTIHQQDTEIYRYVDSRLDKLENKLIPRDFVKNGCEPGKSK